jgi:hypothetical protein
MPLTNNEVLDRLNLLRTRCWPKNDISLWFGINLNGENDPILQQFLIWSEQNVEAVYREPQVIDRCKFELFLHTRQWITRKSAALGLAVTEDSLDRILKAAKDHHVIAATEWQGVFPGVYAEELITGFYKRFNGIRSTTFPHLDAFYTRLHDEIQETLGETARPVFCPTSKVFGQRHYATSADIITGTPMSQWSVVFLDTQKPLQLRPDACSALTYFKHEAVLRDALLGRAPNLTPEQVQHLREYAGSY